MFYRRVLLLGGLALLFMVVPLVQLVRLTLVRGDELRASAEARLISRSWQSTSRGRILDRNGLVLAADRPAYDIAVDYPVISGQWAFTQAAERARRENKARWNELTGGQRQAEVDKWLPSYHAQQEAGWAQFCELAEVSRAVVEERRSAIVAEVSRQAANVVERARAAREEELNRGRELAEHVEVAAAQVARPIREQRTAHVICASVSDRVAFRFPLEQGRRPQDGSSPLLLPGVRLIDSSAREYPFDEYTVSINRESFPSPLRSPVPLSVTVRGVGVHLVGWMRDTLFKEDLDRRPLRRTGDDGRVALDRGGYMPGDRVGSWGVEASAEDDLRGVRGLTVEQLDTGDVQTQSRQPGKDITLTIDARLQARVQALMSPEAGLAVAQPWQNNKGAPPGTPLAAAAAIIDVSSGDILAMVSTPTFTRQQLQDDPRSVFADDQRLPLVNRAIARPYPPGSIVKPLIYCAGAALGAWDPDQRVDCTGHLYPNQPDRFRCWIFKQFQTTHTAQLGHHLDVSEALMVSCNLYFYRLGAALGPERIVEAYRLWGVGRSARRPALGLGDQYAGVAGYEVPLTQPDQEEMGEPAEADAQPARPRMLAKDDAIMMAMGQGRVAWTPLHAADAYATLARAGLRILPRIRKDEPVVTDDLSLPPAAVALALRGLERAVREELGSGHHFTVPVERGGTGEPEATFNVTGVRVWGKSGTADSGQKARDALGGVVHDEHGRPVSIDHSWFVVLAANEGEATPRYAVALVVENGGSGGRVAGPLCNQIVWALKAEGYLK